MTVTSSSSTLWSRNFLLISAINFQLVLIFYFLVVVIVGYAVHELGASTAQAGLISGLFIIGTLLGRLLIAQFLHYLGYRTTLLLGLVGFLLSSGLYFIHSGVTFLLAVRMLHGFTMGIASTVLGTLIAQTIPAARRGEGIGYYSMSSTLGTAIGPFLAIWMSLHVSYSVIFGLSSMLAFNCLACGILIKVAPYTHANQATISPLKTEKQPWFAQFLEPKALPIAWIVLITATCYSGVLSFIHFYAQNLKLEEAASVFFLMYAIAILLSRPLTGKLVDRRGENVVMYPALLIFSVALLLLSQVQQAWMLLFCAGLLGLGFGNIQSVCQTIAVKSTSLQRMGLATSTFFIFLDAGLGFGPFILGKLLNFISYSQLYLASGVMALLCVGFYYVLHGKHTRVSSH